MTLAGRLLEVLHDDTLERKVALQHLAHRLKTEWYPLAVGIFVANHQRQVAARVEHRRKLVDDGADLRQKYLDRSGIRKVTRVVAKLDDVVVRRVQDHELSRLATMLPQQRAIVDRETIARDDLAGRAVAIRLGGEQRARLRGNRRL